MKKENVKVGNVYRNHSINSKRTGNPHNCVVLKKQKNSALNSLIVTSDKSGSIILEGLSEK